MNGRWCVVCASLALATSGFGGTPTPGLSSYWRLGAGYYAQRASGVVAENHTLDAARFDWLLVDVYGGEDVQAINRFLELNPRQKYLVRLWPINNIGRPEFKQLANMLDERYDPNVRPAMERTLREQVRLALGVSKPQNVVGFTFLEEIPYWWALGSAMEDDHFDKASGLPFELKPYRGFIEAERGKPLVWDEETRLWLARVFVESMARIHGIIKQAAPDKLVIYWHHTNFSTLDDFDVWSGPESPPSSMARYPYRFADIIKPGLCEGFMAYPNNAEIFEKKYLRHVREHGWLFFTQLNHPGRFRHSTWAEQLEMAKRKLPGNLGYMLFCTGDCAWWDGEPSPDPSKEDPLTGLRREDNRGDRPRHLRMICAKEKIGLDVLFRALAFEVQLDVPVATAKPGDVIRVVALVRNPKNVSYFPLAPDPTAEATARQVQATLSLPRGFRLDQRRSPRAQLRLGDLPPGGQQTAQWWVALTKPPRLSPSQPIKVTVTSPNTAAAEAGVTQSVALPAFVLHEINGSPAQWLESGYRLNADLRPVIDLLVLSAAIQRPSLSDGVNTLTYNGEISAWQRLLIAPDGTAKLYPVNIVGAPMKELTDPDDPTGFKAWREGYVVARQELGGYLRGGVNYRVTIAGKAEGGANSLVRLRGRTKDDQVWETGLLGNAFTEQWQDNVSAVVNIPAEVNRLESAFLYRYPQDTTGRIWYGGVRIERADIAQDGSDVSHLVEGSSVVVASGTLTTVTYRDESPSRRIQIKLSPPPAAQ